MYEIRQNFLTNNENSGANIEILDHKQPVNTKCNDATTANPPFNSNQYPPYDPQNQTQGNPPVMNLALS